MSTGKFAALGAAFAVAAFVSSAAFAAQEARPVPTPLAKPAVPPRTEAVLNAPAAPSQVTPPAALSAQQPVQSAGVSKPVKVYWFLSGR